MNRRLIALLCAASGLLCTLPAQGEPTIISPPPANGVSPSAPLVFTFSANRGIRCAVSDHALS